MTVSQLYTKAAFGELCMSWHKCLGFEDRKRQSAFISAAESTSEKLATLTRKQLAVLDGIKLGKANKTIAYELSMCESTVKVHVRGIMKKLGARNRTQVAYIANQSTARHACNVTPDQPVKQQAATQHSLP